MLARITVTPKKSVLDPQGKAVEAGLRSLGFHVKDVRVGKLVEVEIDAPDAAAATAMAATMCEKLLANTVIEEYHIEIALAATARAR